MCHVGIISLVNLEWDTPFYKLTENTFFFKNENTKQNVVVHIDDVYDKVIYNYIMYITCWGNFCILVIKLWKSFLLDFAMFFTRFLDLSRGVFIMLIVFRALYLYENKCVFLL